MTDQLVYQMSSQPRGLCLLINNDFKENSAKHRRGSEFDVEKFETVFKNLEFNVITKLNLKSQEALDALLEISEGDQHKHHDALLVVILSHGSRDGILFSDLEMLTFNEIFLTFNNILCHSLVGKPKLFFFGCCRSGQHLISDIKEVNNSSRYSDMMACFACTDGFISYRDVNSGTIFCKALCQSITNYAHKELNEILQQTSVIIEEMCEEPNKQIIQWTYTGWKKKLFFNVETFQR